MKNIIHLFKTDLTNIVKNKAAMLVIIGVMFIPSLYAWFNIIPSWDPYANTSGVKVAITNLDEGAEVEGVIVKVGDDIESALRKDDSLGWEFVDEEEALTGLEQGDYYASIVIPEDFSEKLTSVVTEQPQKPILNYYSNEKISAVAPKVTGAGASGLVENIQSGFVKVANEAIFNMFNEVGIELESNRLSIEKMKESVFRLENELPEIESVVRNADVHLARIEDVIGKTNAGMEKVEDIRVQVGELSEKVSGVLKDGDEAVDQYVSLIIQNLELAQQVVQQMPILAERVTEKGADLDAVLAQVEQEANQLQNGSKALQQFLGILEDTNDILADQAMIEELIVQLESDLEKLQQIAGIVQTALDALESGDHIGVEITEKIDDTVKQLEDRITQVYSVFDTSIVPLIEDDIEKIRIYGPKINETMLDLQQKNARLLDLLSKWKETSGPIDVTQYKEDIETILPIIEESLTRVSTLLNLFHRVNDITGGQLLENPIMTLTNIQEKLQSAQHLLQTTLDAIERGEDISDTFGDTITQQLEAVDRGLAQLIHVNTNIAHAFNQAVTSLQAIEPTIREQLQDLESIAAEMSKLSSEIVELANDPETLIQLLQNLLVRMERTENVLVTLIDVNERLQQRFNEGLFSHSIDLVNSVQNELDQYHTQIVAAIDRTHDGKESVGDVIHKLTEKSVQLDQKITELLQFIDVEFLPKYERAFTTANQALIESDRILTKANEYIPQIYELLEKVEEGVMTGKDGLVKAEEIFPEAKEKVKEMANLIRRLEEKGDLDQLVALMKNDPVAESEFFADPIILEENKLFPMPNYGSAMSPFFTTMSLWVGTLIVTSALIVDVPNKQRYKSYEAYFGRLVTFCCIGLGQAFIVTMGDIFLLKTFVTHKLLFVLFSLLISVVFMTIVYTLVSVFGNTGKVLGIILLVMQLGSSGGTFPIQMTPTFFQNIHAFMPFTHALQLMREAAGGIIWPVVWKSILFLLIYLAIFIFIGIFLKEKINKSSDKFIEKARESKMVL